MTLLVETSEDLPNTNILYFLAMTNMVKTTKVTYSDIFIFDICIEMMQIRLKNAASPNVEIF